MEMGLDERVEKGPQLQRPVVAEQFSQSFILHDCACDGPDAKFGTTLDATQSL